MGQPEFSVWEWAQCKAPESEFSSHGKLQLVEYRWVSSEGV